MSKAKALLTEYSRLAGEAAELRAELKREWATLTVQRMRVIEHRLAELERRQTTIAGLKSVADQIKGS